jgi:hypothetical protein
MQTTGTLLLGSNDAAQSVRGRLLTTVVARVGCWTQLLYRPAATTKSTVEARATAG